MINYAETGYGLMRGAALETLRNSEEHQTLLSFANSPELKRILVNYLRSSFNSQTTPKLAESLSQQIRIISVLKNAMGFPYQNAEDIAVVIHLNNSASIRLVLEKGDDQKSRVRIEVPIENQDSRYGVGQVAHHFYTLAELQDFVDQKVELRQKLNS